MDNLSITDQTGAFELRIPDCGAQLDVRVRTRNFAPKIARQFRPWESHRVTTGADGTSVDAGVIELHQEMRSSSSGRS